MKTLYKNINNTLKMFVAIGVLLGAVFLGTTKTASAATCASVEKTLKSLTKNSKLPRPRIEDSSKTTSWYTLGTGVISLEKCAMNTVLAHEYGHYVSDLASGGNYEEFKNISSKFTVGKNWLKSSKDEGGWERAAHCIGYVLGVQGAYTKCPHKNLQKYAKEVVKLAGLNATLYATTSN